MRMSSNSLLTPAAKDLPVSSLVNFLAFAVFGLLTTLICTYIFTSCRFILQSPGYRRYRGKEPPSLPYWLPWIGNGLQFARRPHALYDYARFLFTLRDVVIIRRFLIRPLGRNARIECL